MPQYKDESRGSWYCKFYYTDWTGARKTKMKRGFPTKREAAAWERDFLQRQQGSPDMTFQALYDLYIEDMAHRLKATTINSKRYVFKARILPFFKDKPINQITPADVRKWQTTIIQSGIKDTSQHQIYNQLNAVLNYAVTFYNLPKNPCKVTGAMGKTKSDRVNFWTQIEFSSFIEQIEDITYRTTFLTLYYTGLRCGELLALTVGDIDLQAGIITVSKTFHRQNRRDVTTSPKTEASNRQVTIPPFLIDVLKDYISRNYGIGPKDRVFQFTTYKLTDALKTGCNLSGVKPIRIHGIRHSHVSLLIEMGFTPHLIAERIGDSVDMVNHTYGHLYPNKHNEVATKLQQLVSK